MKYATKVWMIAGATVLAASMAQARTRYDPMRCEALLLQRESKMHKCLSKCERKAANRPSFDAGSCEEGCRSRFDKASARLRRRAVCTPPSPDPHQCEAQLLRIESRLLVCESGCERRSRNPEFDVEECSASCSSWCDDETAQALDSTICASGRARAGAPGGEE